MPRPRRKRAGAEFGPPAGGVDRGTLTCDGCNGTGKRDRPILEADEDGAFDGAEQIDCHACGGTGKRRATS
jgi:hypothetical protein